MDIVAFHVEFLTPKGEGGSNAYGDQGFVPPQQQPSGAAPASFAGTSDFGGNPDDDVPFAFADTWGHEPVWAARPHHTS